MQDNNKDQAKRSLNNGSSTSTANFVQMGDYWTNGWPYPHYIPNYPSPSPSVPTYPWYVPYTPPQPLQTIINTGTTSSGYLSVMSSYLDKNPEAYVKVNGDRRKNHAGKVYLTDGEEYSFEIFNPSTSTVGVLIEIDGSQISPSKLVLRPGQRTTLDRYIEDNRKFLFKTYEVDDSAEAKSATRNNGAIKLSFYKERVEGTLKIKGSNGSTFNLNANSGTITYTNGNGSTLTANNVGGLRSQDMDFNFCDNSQNDFKGMVNTYFSSSASPEPAEVKLDSLETGRTEMGSYSSQKFETVSVDFYDVCAKVVEFKLLPLSQKPLEPRDLIKHCTECSTKLDRKWKFCGACGHKI